MNHTSNKRIKLALKIIIICAIMVGICVHKGYMELILVLVTIMAITAWATTIGIIRDLKKIKNI